jgi:hypothetical protein
MVKVKTIRAGGSSHRRKISCWTLASSSDNLGPKENFPLNCGEASRSLGNLITIVEYHSEVAIGLLKECRHNTGEIVSCLIIAD